MANRLIDMTGQRFSMLMVLERAPRRTVDTDARWLCRCDCGNLTEVRGIYLRTGRTKSCGCGVHHRRRPRGRVKTGDRFNCWTVISDVAAYPGDPNNSYRYVQCDCGKIKLVPTSNLVTGASKSCGCGALQR